MDCFGEAYEVGVWGGGRAACVAGEFVWRARQPDQRSGRERAVNCKKTHLPGGFVARSRPPSVALSQWQRRSQRERKKGTRFRSAKQQLCTCVTPFCTFLSRRCTNTTLKYLISCFVEDGNTRQLSFSFPELLNSPLEINSKKTCQPVTN